MNSEILKQIAKIDEQIQATNHIHNAAKRYVDCDLKTKVMEQAVGTVRGLEIGKEALEFLLVQVQTDQMTTDEFFLQQERERKK